MEHIIGIDLGTTTSAAAYMDGDDPVVIPNDRGNRITPSVVAFDESGAILVGESAKNQAVINASRTASHIKRRMGDTGWAFQVDGRRYTAPELSAFILRKLKEDAERYLGGWVGSAVITVPAHFGDTERKATMEAGHLAGLRVPRILNEPTSAALAYARRWGGSSRILVYDLGGGTFDVTCLAKEAQEFTVRSTAGDSSLGGVDFDRLLLERVVADFERQSGLELRQDPVMMQQLTELCERAKIELSNQESASVALPFISAGAAMHLRHMIRRDELNELISELVRKTVKLTLRAVKEAGFGVEGIDALVLSGGSSRIPLVHGYLRRALGLGEVALVNPDEIVACGAAVQAALLEQTGLRAVLRDVTAFNLGVEIDGGIFVPVVRRNSRLPVVEKRVFTTVADGQDSVEVHVLQGDSEVARENQSLGRFLLSGIRDAPKGQPRIDVEFRLDEDGLATIAAQDLDTLVAQKISVAPLSDADALPEDAVERKAALELSAALSRVDLLVQRNGDRLTDGLAADIVVIIKRAREAVSSKDPPLIRRTLVALKAAELELTFEAEEQGLGRA